ncbi:MAG: site-specific integrase [Rhodospirillaceae bacterium]
MPKRNPGARLEWREDRQTWEIIWFERGARRRKSCATTDRRIADRLLAEHLTPPAPTGPCDPNIRRLDDVLMRYASERGPHVKGKETLGYCLKALQPFWGNRVVQDVKEGSCREYFEARSKGGVGPSKVARELGVLSAAIRHDWKNGRLTNIAPIWKPSEPEPKERWLTRQDVAKLLRAARSNEYTRHHLSLFILLGLYTAGRKEAILSLRWPQVDFERRLIDLNPAGRERTNKGRAVVPVSARLMTFLRYSRKRGCDTGFVVSYNGHPISNIKKAFAHACERAGLKDVTPHTLRHTSATWMASAGVPMELIARYLGHSNSRTTERVYAKFAPEYLAQAARALDHRH